jgi:uncharacterized protein (DUF885 family)
MFRLWALCFAVSALVSAQAADDFFKKTFEEMLRADPEFATMVGRHDWDDHWTDWSKQGRVQRRQFFEERLNAANAFQTSHLSAEDRLTLRVLQYDFRSRLDAWELETDLLRVGQLFGFHNRIYLLVDIMPSRTVRDYRNIIARIRAMPLYVDQNIGIMDEAIDLHLMQPKLVADLVSEQVAAQTRQTRSTRRCWRVSATFLPISAQRNSSNYGGKQPKPTTNSSYQHGGSCTTI